MRMLRKVAWTNARKLRSVLHVGDDCDVAVMVIAAAAEVVCVYRRHKSLSVSFLFAPKRGRWNRRGGARKQAWFWPNGVVCGAGTLRRWSVSRWSVRFCLRLVGWLSEAGRVTSW